MKSLLLIMLSILSLHAMAEGKPVCGLEGSIEQRIKDCFDKTGISNPVFMLVSRVSDFDETYMDVTNNNLWSDRLPKAMTQYKGIEACKNLKPESGIEASWRLPSLSDYEKANERGIRDQLPRMNKFFWTSTIWDRYQAWMFFGGTGWSHYFYRQDSDERADAVRCIGRAIK